MEKLHAWVLIAGIVMTVVGLALAGKRVVFLFRLITSGQPAPDRIAGVTGRLGLALKTQVVEVFGQKKLLKWSIPGTAHFFVFWAFIILGSVYFEAFAALISRNPDWHWFIFGSWAVLGFVQDLIAVLCLFGIIAFWQIRVKNSPERLGRNSRFAGSHLGGAYFVLFMIFNVLWTLFLYRAAVEAHSPAGEGYGKAAFVSWAIGKVLPDSLTLIGVGLLLHIGIMLIFLVDVVNSKHLHIFVAPINVLFGRRPVALGAVKPLISAGKPVTMEDVEEMDDDARLGIGSIEDFTWKGLLDMATCTECGRCQSQCPAWNTEKPLSPKMLILNLRDHAFATGDYLLADEDTRAKMLADPEHGATLTKEVERPLIGDESVYGVIDPDVLWSCVNCGACVNQCPVDIEHVDHIVDMRRYQVLVESNFPAELNGLFKGMEGKGNPWNMSSSMRLDWTKGLDFEVKVVGDTIESLDEVEWLFWVGCAGAYEDRAKKTTRAVAELLDIAGVSFGVLGNGETCTGDSARRAGNEFLFQGLAMQNVETFKEHKVKKVVSTCAHCFNTLKNEYQEFGIELEVVHHTQLLNRLVREGKLTPVKDGAGAHKRSITYHDPCFIGRHNGVYSPPRELLQVLPGAEFVEMERNSERSFCCGAGGARMWMEENIGTRINENRTAEAVGTGADQIAVGCPFCRVMLSDGLTSAQQNGAAREEVEVLDVAQMLLASVKGEQATKLKPGEGGTAAPVAKRSVETKAEPEAGDVTAEGDTITETADAGPAAKASGGSSMFDDPSSMFGDDADAAPATTKVAEPSSDEAGGNAKPAGGSLFDDASSMFDEPTPKADKPTEESVVTSTSEATTASPKVAEGGSLFDLNGDEAEQKAEAASPSTSSTPAPEADESPVDTRNEVSDSASTKPATSATTPSADLGSGGSLFDLQPEAPAEPAPKAPEPEPATTEPEPAAKAEPVQTEPVKAAPAEKAAPAVDLGSGSLFDLAAPQTVATASPTSAPVETEAPSEPEVGSEPEPEAPSEPEVTSEPEPEAPSEPEVTSEPEPEAPSEPEAEGEAEAETPSEAPAEEKTEDKPAAPAASGGPVNTPKTDADISGAGSLFDL